MDRIIEIAKQLVDAEPAELAIADSIGVAVPNQITELVGRLQSEVGPIPLRFHLHNTRNTGLANARRPLMLGLIPLMPVSAGLVAALLRLRPPAISLRMICSTCLADQDWKQEWNSARSSTPVAG